MYTFSDAANDVADNARVLVYQPNARLSSLRIKKNISKFIKEDERAEEVLVAAAAAAAAVV